MLRVESGHNAGNPQLMCPFRIYPIVHLLLDPTNHGVSSRVNDAVIATVAQHAKHLTAVPSRNLNPIVDVSKDLSEKWTPKFGH
jgi:hypothetical protein